MIYALNVVRMKNIKSFSMNVEGHVMTSSKGVYSVNNRAPKDAHANMVSFIFLHKNSSQFLPQLFSIRIRSGLGKQEMCEARRMSE